MTKYSYELKKQVVQDYLEGLGGYKKLAKKYNLASKGIILNWLNVYDHYRVSKYYAQRNRFRVTKEFFELADIYCHRIIPKNLGGKDNFQNLVIIYQNIHQLIHENDKTRASFVMTKMRITGVQLEIINQFRKKVKNCELSLNL